MSENAFADRADPSADPGQATTRRGFLEALARLRVATGDTYKSLELKTGVPRSTLSDMLTGRRVPRREVVERVVAAYAPDPGRTERWMQTWSRLAVQEALPADDAAPVGTAANDLFSGHQRVPHVLRRHQRVGRVLGIVLALGLIAAFAVAVFGVFRPTRPAASLISRTVPSGSLSSASPSPTRAAALQVYNVEKSCRRPRTDTCALFLSRDPHAPRSTDNRAGQVWHGDTVLAQCRVDDGRLVTDEELHSSHTWYRVRVPGTQTSGWLPGIRIHTRKHVPPC